MSTVKGLEVACTSEQTVEREIKEVCATRIYGKYRVLTWLARLLSHRR